MKLLKLTIKGLPLFKNDLDIDFIAQRRVGNNDKEYLYHLFSNTNVNVYINQTISFIGLNASGKTTILKVLSFIIELLNNNPLNSISTRDIFDALDHKDKVTIVVYFYHNNEINKLQSIVEKEVKFIDGSERLIFRDEILWSKSIHTVTTKKSILDFKDTDRIAIRNQNEQYLLDDVSIIVASNKKHDTNLFLYSALNITDHNLLSILILGKYPKEILTFLDPSIEYLYARPENKKIDIRLKFYGKDEIILNNPVLLNNYLSSGTIKGLSVFMGAIFTFQEGGYLIVDEIENHFNKEIVSTLVRFFLNKKVNKNGATLIFSTHYSVLLDEFERNDGIYIVRNIGGITAERLSDKLSRNDIKRSEIYDSDLLKGTAPSYESYIALKKVLVE